MVENPQYGSYLREFVDEFESAQVFHAHEIKRTERDSRLPAAAFDFASTLRKSLTERFHKLHLWESMSIFCPKTFPKSVQEKASFGNTKLNKLICHFGESRGHNTPL